MVGRECSQVDQGSMHSAACYWYKLMNYWGSNYICEPLTVTNSHCHQYPAVPPALEKVATKMAARSLKSRCSFGNCGVSVN